MDDFPSAAQGVLSAFHPASLPPGRLDGGGEGRDDGERGSGLRLGRIEQADGRLIPIGRAFRFGGGEEDTVPFPLRGFSLRKRGEQEALFLPHAQQKVLASELPWQSAHLSENAGSA